MLRIGRWFGFLSLAAMAASGSASAGAEQWLPLGGDDHSTTAFLDTDSITAEGATRSFTMKYTMPSVPEVAYTLIRHKMDCTARTVDDLHMKAVDKAGAVLFDQDDTSPPRPLLPGSKGETIFAKVCK